MIFSNILIVNKLDKYNLIIEVYKNNFLSV